MPTGYNTELAEVLQNRNLTITSYLAHIFKVFEDFKLIAELRKEIDMVKPSLNLAT